MSGTADSECINLAQVVGDLADVRAQAMLLFSHSLAMKDETDAAACGFAARNLRMIADRGMARLEKLRQAAAPAVRRRR